MGTAGRFASTQAPYFATWRTAVNQSRFVQSLRQLLRSPNADKRFILYLLDGRELWARSYQQWVALRSQDPDLSQVLELWRTGDATSHNGIWPDAEFGPIAQEIDRIMERLGWRR